MVRYVRRRIKLQTGQTVRAEVCHDSGLAYHRRGLQSFRTMVETANPINPQMCTARVLSFTRNRTQKQGGPINMIFRESDLPNVREMGYIHPMDRTRLENARSMLTTELRHLMFQGKERTEYQGWDYDAENWVPPESLLDAILGVTQTYFRGECEIMVTGCIPLKKALKIEYWAGPSVDCYGGGMGGYWETFQFTRYTTTDGREVYNDLDRELFHIRSVALLCAKLGKPFEVKSCYKSVSWYDEKEGSRVWAKLDGKALRRMSYGERPKFTGYGDPPERYRHCRCKQPPAFKYTPTEKRKEDERFHKTESIWKKEHGYQ